MNRTFFSFLPRWIVFLLVAAPTASAQEPPPDPSTWMDRVQVYSNVAISPEKARRLGITVNGLWNGWGTLSPVASMSPELIHWRLFSDAGYVERIHEAGLRHGSTLSSIYSHQLNFKKHPELKEAVCRTIEGEVYQMLDEGDWYIGNPLWMCQNSPLWRAALYDRAKRAVQAGTDVILFDEPFGDTFFGSLPHPEFIGFSKGDLQRLSRDLEANFDARERQEIFGLSGFAPSDLRRALAKVNYLKWLTEGPAATETSPEDRLWKRFKQIQIQSNFEQKKWLVEAIRKYSRTLREEPIPIGMNLAELEAFSFGAQPVPVLYLAELCDFLAYELVYRPPPRQRHLGDEEIFVLPPRGKWMPWHKLGVALVGPHRSLALPSQNFIDTYLFKDRRINYLCQLFAEAYAGRGALILDLKCGEYGEEAEEKIGRYSRFVGKHADLFENLEEVAPIAIIYSYGRDTTLRYGSYIGLSQALYESGLPFSVIYSTPDRPRRPITRSALKPYRVLFVPAASTLNPEQRKRILEYVEKDGGTIVLLDPKHGFPVPEGDGVHRLGTGEIRILSSHDPAQAYFESYSEEDREILWDIALACLTEGSPVVLPQTRRKWSVVPYAQPQSRRAVIHVLNYDYDEGKDDFRPLNSLNVLLRPAKFGLPRAEEYTCLAYSPERCDPSDLPCKYMPDSGKLEITIPELHIYEILVVSPR